jgi:3-deoxy-D-manno-octulosonic-acid transferase
LLGGSFEPLGGQNLIEAAACGCPVILGPHTFNFAEAAELAVAAGAAVRVDTLAQAVDQARVLMADPIRLGQMRDAASRFTADHRGAVSKTVAAVVGLLY